MNNPDFPRKGVGRNKANFPHEAIAAIDDILQYGRSKHAEGSWRSESVKHHVEKAKGHIQDWLYEVERGEDHLACALTRMAMALSVRAAEGNDLEPTMEDLLGSETADNNKDGIAPEYPRHLIGYLKIDPKTGELKTYTLDMNEDKPIEQIPWDTVLKMEDYSK